MKNNKISIVICFVAMIVCACEAGDRAGMTASLEYREIIVKEHNLNLDANGTNYRELTIWSTNASWSVESLDEWIHVDTKNDIKDAIVKVTADKYTNTETERTGMIIVKSTIIGWGFADTVFVKQSAAYCYVQTVEDTYEIGANGGELIIPIEANTDWEATSNKDWVALEKINNKQLKAVVNATTSSSSREATLSFILKNSNSYYNTYTKIKQEAAQIKVEHSSYDMPANGGELLVNIEANVNWIASSSEDDWLAIEKINETQLKIITKPTTSPKSRSATVGLKSPNMSYTMTNFSVKQDAGSVNISENRFNLNKDAQSVDVIIDANTDWSVEVANTTWISVSQNKGTSGRTKLTITIDKAYNSRNSDVYIKIGNTRVQSITIWQS